MCAEAPVLVFQLAATGEDSQEDFRSVCESSRSVWRRELNSTGRGIDKSHEHELIIQHGDIGARRVQGLHVRVELRGSR